MIINHGIHLIILSVLLLIVGLIKPKWILFFLDEPSRMAIVMLSTVLFMGGVTLFSEGKRLKEMELVNEEAPATQPETGAEPAVDSETIPSAVKN